MASEEPPSDDDAVPAIEEVYGELRAIAASKLRGDGAHTLQATAVVNEAWIRLARGDASWQTRSHFLATAAKAMRHVLVDHARGKRAAKRGGAEAHRVTLVSSAAVGEPELDVLDLDRALERMGAEHERAARVVELKFFGGLTIEEIAETLGVSHMTVSSDWRRARVWLSKELA